MIHMLVDNFDYKKANLTESLVKDIQVLIIGELSTYYKDSIQQFLKPTMSKALISFINCLSNRTVQLFENKDMHANQLVVKDFVGLNLLLALTLNNITRIRSATLLTTSEESGNEEHSSSI